MYVQQKGSAHTEFFPKQRFQQLRIKTPEVGILEKNTNLWRNSKP